MERGRFTGKREHDILLIADGVRSVNRFLAYARENGCLADGAFNRETAWERLTVTDYRVIVLDSAFGGLMNSADAVDFVKEIRRAGIRTPIVLIHDPAETSNAFTAIFEQGGEAEAALGDYCLCAKPFTITAIWETVSRFVRCRFAASEEVYRFGKTVYRPERKRLSFGDRFVEIGDAEGRLLSFFLADPGRFSTLERIVRREMVRYTPKREYEEIERTLGFLMRKFDYIGSDFMLERRLPDGYRLIERRKAAEERHEVPDGIREYRQKEAAFFELPPDGLW